MASVNVCSFIGRAGQDPTVKFTASGTAVANVSIACDEKYKNKTSGEWESKTEWIPLVFWGKLAEIVGEYVTKGKEIYVSGRFTTRSWEDKEGNKRFSSEVVCSTMQLLGSKGDSQGKGSGGDHGGNYRGYDNTSALDPFDDVPF